MFLPTWVVAFHEFTSHVFYAKALACEEHDKVVKHVRTLVDKAFVAAVCGFDDEFQSLFSHFLSHTIQAVLEERGCVAAFGHLFVSLLNEVRELGQEEQRIRFILFAPTGIAACVTSRTVGFSLNQQGIIVAIALYIDQVQVVTTGLTLCPKAPAGTAEERNKPGVLCLLQRFLVHKHVQDHCVPGLQA